MPKFECSRCGEPFEVPQPALDKFPGWEPKYCRKHSPKKASKKTSKKSKSRRSGNGTASTPADVLDKHTEGPKSGVFTDGGSHPNPGPGGWGWVWVEDDRIVREDSGHDPDTTNNRMELTALIGAYEALPEDASVVVYSDSRLCVDTITKWAPGWERKGWVRKGEPLKNLDLVKRLLALHRSHPDCRLEWIASHSGYRWNEYADALAGAWREPEG